MLNICTVDRTSQPEELMLHPRDRCDVTALVTHVNKCTEVNWMMNFDITSNRKMMKNGLHIFKFSDFLTSLHLIRRKNIFFCPTTNNLIIISQIIEKLGCGWGERLSVCNHLDVIANVLRALITAEPTLISYTPRYYQALDKWLF